MSTQLILYPQNYKGYSATTTGATEYVVDGINYKKYPSFILDGYNWDEDTSERIWKTDEETGESIYESEINEE